MSRQNSVPARRLRLVALLASAAVLFVVVTSAALVLHGWRAQQVAEVDESAQPLTEQEIAEIKAAVEKETGKAVRYVGRHRQGVVDVFTSGPLEGGYAYRVGKVDGRWRVIEKFMAFSA